MLPRKTLTITPLLLLGTALCNTIHLINSPKGLIDLSKEVAAGDFHVGVTVFLNNDIDFDEGGSSTSDDFEPIGNSWKKYFQGTFDGHGYVIRNLNMNSSTEFAGLFGYSRGLTIRNLVLDSTCTIANAFNSIYQAYASGAVSYCMPQDRACVVENSVNMADIEFVGYIKSTAELSGIAAHISSSEYGTVIHNCANYGSITRVGDSLLAYMGGIVGGCDSSAADVRIYNSLNTGRILYECEIDNTRTYIGGIIGYSSCDVTIMNCMNTGEVRAVNQSAKRVGQIMGGFDSTAVIFIKHCFWTNASYSVPVNNSAARVSNSSSVTPGKAAVDSMNSFAEAKNRAIGNDNDGEEEEEEEEEDRLWAMWMWNENGTDVRFTVNKEGTFELAAQVFVVPDIVGDESHVFSGWFMDESYTSSLNITAVPAQGGLALYAGWLYTLSFDTSGGPSIEPVRKVYKSTYSLPRNMTKSNCNLSHWNDEFGDVASWDYQVPGFNTTLSAVWLCTALVSPRDLIDFSEIVNSGTNFSGTTVYLKNDITFDATLSKKFMPIGKDEYNTFAGVFDGKGYMIDGLNVRTVSHYTGLFGISLGAVIRNVVMGPSCSIQSTYVGFPDLGGIIGRGKGKYGDMIVDNCVNMGSVNYAERTGSYLFIGGIAGIIIRNSNVCVMVRNCAYYGDITFSGKESTRIFVGGVVGEAEGSSTNKSIRNCANYGRFINNGGDMDIVNVGGVVGAIWDNPIVLRNSLSMGSLGYCDLKGCNNSIGAIVGYVAAGGDIKNCYWTEDVGDYNAIGYANTSKVLLIDDTHITTMNSTLLDKLNTHEDSGSNPWFTLHLNGGRIGSIRQDKLFVAQKYFPDPVREGYTFMGWFLDEEYHKKYALRNTTVSNDTNIYAKWSINTYTINFTMFGGKYIEPLRKVYNETVVVPHPGQKKNCAFVRWEDGKKNVFQEEFTMPARNLTLHAVWSCSHISKAGELVGLSRAVNSGKECPDIVYLNEDIVLHDELAAASEPIGVNKSHSFGGVFNGQGHTIHIYLNTSFKYAGLFGYFRGTIINTVIVDGSTIIGRFSGTGKEEEDDAYLGGFAGYCDSCAIKNSVSLAETSFIGSGIGNLYIGGFAGEIAFGSATTAAFENCANYGCVEYSGSSSSTVAIGGLVGYFHGQSSSHARISNCFSYATIRVDERVVTEHVAVGGIAGKGANASFEGCISAGKITPGGGLAESIVGSASGVEIARCYWTGNVGYNNTQEAEGSHIIELDNSTVSKLNRDNSVSIGNGKRGRKRLLLNTKGSNVTFRISGNGFRVTTQLIQFPDPANYGKRTFRGWYLNDAEFNEETVYVATTLDARFEDAADTQYTVFVAVGLVVAFAVVVVVAAVAVVYHCFYKEHKRRQEVKMYIEPLLYDKLEDSLDDMDFIYPAGYKRLPLDEALTKGGGVDPAVAQDVVAQCYRGVNLMKSKSRLPRRVTVDDAAAICLYTLETNKMEVNPYELINSALMVGTVDAIRPVKDFLYLVMSALRKLPIYYGKPLYRGIRMNVVNRNTPQDRSLPLEALGLTRSGSKYDERLHLEFDDDYMEGEEVVWRALSSTSPNVAVTKAFLAKGTTSGKAEGTLFIIENGWGYNVQSCSMFPGEAEIVLEPERRFRVKTVIPGEGLTIIKIEMLRTPIVLPEVFGENKFL